MAMPKFRVYVRKECVAACQHAVDAAILVAALGEGSSIHYGRDLILWREGEESQSARESYDFVADTMKHRLEAYWSGKLAASGEESR